MKRLIIVLTALLALLAVASGIPKVMLMEQEVLFFGAYGISDGLLIMFGLSQVLAGVLLIMPKTRVAGGLLLALTFTVSAVMLWMAGNVMMATVTIAFLALIGLVIAKTRALSNAA